jgi:sec-independent protein translocase protein TatA
MPNVGPLELAIVLIIALIVFGPKRLPELGRSLGRGIREFRASVSGERGTDDSPAEVEPAKPAADEAGEHEPLTPDHR